MTVNSAAVWFNQTPVNLAWPVNAGGSSLSALSTSSSVFNGNRLVRASNLSNSWSPMPMYLHKEKASKVSATSLL